MGIPQAFLSLNGIPKISLILTIDFKLSLLRKILIKFFPDDFIFIINNEEINQKDNDNLISNFLPKKSESQLYLEINIFSHKLYNKNKLKIKTNIQFDKFKILENYFFFTLYEYPQSLKKENDFYYSIILYGFEENNINFIDGFLNFLLNINDEDNYRFKLECKDKKNNNLIEQKYFQSIKGNFYFICINKKTFSEKEDEEIKNFSEEEILKFLINEKYINHFILTNEEDFTNYFENIDIEEIKNFENNLQNFFSFMTKKNHFEFLKSYIKDYNNNKEIFNELHKYLFEEYKKKIEEEKEEKNLLIFENSEEFL